MLGILEKVELREVWAHEALNFTKWLSAEENLMLLSEALGIEQIVCLETEASVGSFNVDILAEEGEGGRKVIIENQLERTDHDHLGKLITYAAGHDAGIIIWLVKQARDEHRCAVEWLNEHVDSKVNFFLVEIELWRIGESMPAPQFQVVSRPNDWAKTVKRTSLTNREAQQMEFWTGFNDYCSSVGTSFNQRKPYPQSWYHITIGTSKAYISLNILKDRIGCGIWIPNAMEVYENYFQNKSEIEEAIGVELIWEAKDGYKASQIIVWNHNLGFSNVDCCQGIFQWFVEYGEKFKKVFSKYLQ